MTLLDDKFAPITWVLGFIEAPIDAVVEAHKTWLTVGYQGVDLSHYLAETIVTGRLDDVLNALHPLRDPFSKVAFIPTDSNWSLMLTNKAYPDMGRIDFYHGQMLNCRTLVLHAIPQSHDHGFWDQSRLEEIGFDLYIPETRSNAANPFGRKRYIHTRAWHGWRVKFQQLGEPLPFEDLSRYRFRKRRNGFTKDLLEQYAQVFDLHPFDNRFYMPDPDSQAILLEQSTRAIVSATDNTIIMQS